VPLCEAKCQRSQLHSQECRIFARRKIAEKSDPKVEKTDQKIEKSDQKVEKSDQKVEKSDQKLEQDFEDFDLVPALRFLAWRARDRRVHSQLTSLCSNMEEKVI
jgi:hypothetical protein